MTSQLIYWLEYIVNFTGTIAYVFFLYLLIRRFLILRSERKLFILASFLMLTTLSGPIIYLSLIHIYSRTRFEKSQLFHTKRRICGSGR